MQYRIYRDKKNDWRWTLVVENGEILADSAEGYNRKKDCLAGVALVMSSHEAPIVFKKKAKEAL